MLSDRAIADASMTAGSVTAVRELSPLHSAPKTLVPSRPDPAITPSTSRPNRKAPRILALDFTKGALVLLMVLYHWLNYFVGNGSYAYRYLRFITPSFIFIAGFLMPAVYLSNRALSSGVLGKRLVWRGLKLFGIFLALNAAASLHVNLRATEATRVGSVYRIAVACLTGNIALGNTKLVSFYILVPIGALLLLTALLALLLRRCVYTVHIVVGIALCVLFGLWVRALSSPNLELITIGLIGLLIGFVPIQSIKAVAGRPYVLGVAYAMYVIGLALWNAVYPLQIAGVCLNVMLIYLIGERAERMGSIGRTVVLLGKYSLFGYIVQIAILQLLHRAMSNIVPESLRLVLSLFVAMMLTIGTVKVMDYLRFRWSPVNRLYGVVFS